MSQDGPEINYLAKDYSSFRRLMLDRLALLLPGGVEDQPADLQVALVELLAYAADHLSYYQDAVATEAYLGTARNRVSIRRHARLLGYKVHEGCNARVWIRCRVGREVTVGSDWRFLTRETEPVVFEPCHFPRLYPQHNEITLYLGDEGTFTLSRGATRVCLAQSDPKLNLKPGDTLLLGTCGRDTDVTLRHVVRLKTVEEHDRPETVEVAWGAEDALPFDLPVRRKAGDGRTIVAAQAFGNLVLSDNGERRRSKLDGSAPFAAAWRPVIPAGPLTRAEPLPDDFTKPERKDIVTSAAGVMTRDARGALPSISLEGEGDTWHPSPDLLGCSRTDPSFVVETGNEGKAHLRFGDGIHGRAPTAGEVFEATYRIGNGRAGNVGVDTITRVEGDKTDEVEVNNPLPASGGEDPESSEEVRLFAPWAFRRQMRAVNGDDYAARAQSHPEVERATAEIRWTGSWYTVYLYIDRLGGGELDDEFKRELLQHMDGYRLAGYDIEIREPISVPLEIKLFVDIRQGFVPGAVMAPFLDAFGAGISGGRRGFFHPDNWTLGQSVYLSRFYSAALAVPGVEAVDVTVFQRAGDPRGKEARDRGVVTIRPHEVVSRQLWLNGEPAEDGRLAITIRGV